MIIAVDDGSLGNQMVEPELLSVLQSDAEELCAGACGSLRLFHWRFAEHGVRTAAPGA